MPFYLDSTIHTAMQDQMQFLYERCKNAETKDIANLTYAMTGLARMILSGIRESEVVAERIKNGDIYVSVDPLTKNILHDQIQRLRRLEDASDDESAAKLADAMLDLFRVSMAVDHVTITSGSNADPRHEPLRTWLSKAEKEALEKMLQALSKRSETANAWDIIPISHAMTDVIRMLHAGQKLPSRW